MSEKAFLPESFFDSISTLLACRLCLLIRHYCHFVLKVSCSLVAWVTLLKECRADTTPSLLSLMLRCGPTLFADDCFRIEIFPPSSDLQLRIIICLYQVHANLTSSSQDCFVIFALLFPVEYQQRSPQNATLQPSFLPLYHRAPSLQIS